MSENGTQVSCRQLVELVTDYLEGQLDPAREAALDAHLQDCHGCDTYVEQMRQTVIALRGLADGEEISEEARRTVLAAFAEHRPSG